MLPNFYIVGAARSATDALYSYLRQHPEIYMSPIKETNFFVFYGKPVEYRGPGDQQALRSCYVPSLAQYEELFRPGGDARALGEASPWYLYMPDVPARIQQHTPRAKMIAILRNPIDRAFSGYQLQRAIGAERLSFEEAIAREPERLAGEDQRLLADPSHRSASHRHHSYLARGRYAEQLERWFAHYPRDRFLIMTSEQFFADPAAAVRRTTRFLGVPDRPLPAFQNRTRGGSGERMSGEMRARLEAEFEQPNRRLEELLGIECGWQ